MIPGISSTTEARLAAILRPEITDFREDTLLDCDLAMFAAHEPAAARLGIEVTGGEELTVVVTDPDRKLGNLRVQAAGKNNVMFFDNRAWAGNCFGNARMLGSDCLMCFADIRDGYVAIHDLLLRSNEQLLFWGTGATAVGVSMEMEGTGRSLVIGDDALISNGVWIRNHDMHAVHDLSTGEQLNPTPVDCILERHVWLGQDTLLLGCERIGMGSIAGARALVKGSLPANVAAGGIPARVLREDVSWGRASAGMTNAERRSIGLSDL